MRTSSAFNQPRETGFTHKPKPSAGSWWLTCKSQADFYAKARDRFPESGSAVVDRSKEFTGTVIGPSFKTRASRLRREERDRVGYRA